VGCAKKMECFAETYLLEAFHRLNLDAKEVSMKCSLDSMQVQIRELQIK